MSYSIAGRSPRARFVVLFLGCAVGVATLSCAGAAQPASPPSGHGTLTEMSRVSGDIVLCNHKVPESVCTRHHPELAARFKRAGDWCKPHKVPESQCFKCHPDLTFEPLPKLPPGADVAWLSRRGEDVPSLDEHVVRGKVTVFEFYADWCAACRKVDGYIYKRIADGDTTLAYRKINIVSWESPVGKRYMSKVPSLPLIVVYGKDGKRSSSLHGAKLDALKRAIRRGAKQ